ncbi:hypothetical protein K439DRAFT_992139 [Ramaria rubella]|nr:hypothetical protein K439DRAFT_992139 [Ramaria rubella]
MSVENGRSGVTLQARASHFVRKIFGGRKLANDRQSASRTGPIIISRYRASSMDIPRKPFVSPSQPALSLPLRPDMYSEGSSNTSISTNALSEQPIITHKKGASTPAMDIPRPAPSVQFSLPGIIVTHHPSTPPATRGNGLPVRPPESGPQSNASREAIETLVPLQARSPTLRPFSPSSLPAAFEGMNSFGIPSGLISPMALDPSAAQTPPLARSTSAATSDPAYALTSAPLPTEPVVQSRRSSAPQLPSFPPAFASTTPSSTRVDKQGHSLRLSPAIIQRVPPWPIKNLPSISLYGISNSNSGPAARKPPPARRMTLDVYLEPSPSSSQRRPSPSRLSTMPTLSMNGRSHERQTTERESPDHELGQDMEDDEIEEIGAQGRDFRAVVQGHFGRASMESTRSADGDESDSARTERGPGRTEEIVGRPSMDSIDEDGRWTPTPSPSPSTSTFPERWQMPFASPSAQVKDTFTKGPISLGSAFGWGGTSAFAPASGMGATTSPNAGPSFHATSGMLIRIFSPDHNLMMYSQPRQERDILAFSRTINRMGMGARACARRHSLVWVTDLDLEVYTEPAWRMAPSRRL